jgi:hypothetical protein
MAGVIVLCRYPGLMKGLKIESENLKQSKTTTNKPHKGGVK